MTMMKTDELLGGETTEAVARQLATLFVGIPAKTRAPGGRKKPLVARWEVDAETGNLFCRWSAEASMSSGW